VVGEVKSKFRPGNLVLQLMLGLISASGRAEKALAAARPTDREQPAPARAGQTDTLIALALGLLSARGSLLQALEPLRKAKRRPSPASRRPRRRAPGSLLR
jgi:hypothetical protein